MIPRRMHFAWLVLVPTAAHAYRPFEGTDADVAEVDELEFEVGPAQVVHTDGETALTPGMVLNLGAAEGVELVVDLDGALPFTGARALISDALVKGVIRRGSLQDASGPSVAIETGVLLPDLPRRGSTAGWSFAVIASQRTDDVTLHLNVAAAYERSRDLSIEASAIVEGPARWRVRPVAEVVVGKTEHAPREESLLAGAIWRLSEHVSLDAAGVIGREDAATAYQLRLGFTWAFALKGDA